MRFFSRLSTWRIKKFAGSGAALSYSRTGGPRGAMAT